MTDYMIAQIILFLRSKSTKMLGNVGDLKVKVHLRHSNFFKKLVHFFLIGKNMIDF